jgi:hypothetical protein
MKRDPKTITEEIINLVSELAALAGVPISEHTAQLKKPSSSGKKDKSGATGGIRLLIETGKMDSPKQMPEITELLRQEDRYYPRQNVAMALLNLVREKVLTRLREGGEKKWKYVVRR